MFTEKMMEMMYGDGALEQPRCSSAEKGMPTAKELALKELVASGSGSEEDLGEEMEMFDLPEEKGSQRMIFDPGTCAI